MEYNKADCLPPPVLYIERMIAYGLSNDFCKYMKGGRYDGICNYIYDLIGYNHHFNKKIAAPVRKT